MSERFVIFSKPRVRDSDGKIYALAWDGALRIITKATGRTTDIARRNAIEAAMKRADEAAKPLAEFLAKRIP